MDTAWVDCISYKYKFKFPRRNRWLNLTLNITKQDVKQPSLATWFGAFYWLDPRQGGLILGQSQAPRALLHVHLRTGQLGRLRRRNRPGAPRLKLRHVLRVPGPEDVMLARAGQLVQLCHGDGESRVCGHVRSRDMFMHQPHRLPVSGKLET